MVRRRSQTDTMTLPLWTEARDITPDASGRPEVDAPRAAYNRYKNIGRLSGGVAVVAEMTQPTPDEARVAAREADIADNAMRYGLSGQAEFNSAEAVAREEGLAAVREVIRKAG